MLGPELAESCLAALERAVREVGLGLDPDCRVQEVTRQIFHRFRELGSVEALARSTDLSIRDIHKQIAGRASRGIVGEITKHTRALQPPAL